MIAASIVAEVRLWGNKSSFWVVEALSISSFLAIDGLFGGACVDFDVGMPTIPPPAANDFGGGASFDFAVGIPNSGALAAVGRVREVIFDFAVGRSVPTGNLGGARFDRAMSLPCDMSEY